MSKEKMVYKTNYWKNPPLGGSVYDDESVVFYTNTNNKFIFLELEFDALSYGMYDLYWNYKKIKYIQVLREWNELIGFNDIGENASEIQDLNDMYNALKVVLNTMETENDFLERQKENNDFLCPSIKDITEFVNFLKKILHSKLRIYVSKEFVGSTVKLN